MFNYNNKKWRDSVDEGVAFDTLWTDQWKAIERLLHELLIAKFYAYGFDMKSQNLIYGYLFNRKKRIKVGGTYSSWWEILYGVPQKSILGPLLFSIFLCDLFYFLEGMDIASL